MSRAEYVRILRREHLGIINDYLTSTLVVVPPTVTR